MEIIKRGKITYYIKKESIIASINDFQHIAFTVYPLQNRKPFYDFRNSIKSSAQNELTQPSDIIVLAQKYNLRGVATSRPKVEE